MKSSPSLPKSRYTSSDCPCSPTLHSFLILFDRRLWAHQQVTLLSGICMGLVNGRHQQKREGFTVSISWSSPSRLCFGMAASLFCRPFLLLESHLQLQLSLQVSIISPSQWLVRPRGSVYPLLLPESFSTHCRFALTLYTPCKQTHLTLFNCSLWMCLLFPVRIDQQ